MRYRVFCPFVLVAAVSCNRTEQPKVQDLGVLFTTLEKVFAAMPAAANDPDCRKRPDQTLVVLGLNTVRNLLGDKAPSLESKLYPTGLDDFRISNVRARGTVTNREDARQAMENLAGATHIAVYRVDAYAAPVVAGNTFTPGSATATVAVFAKDSGALTCATKVTATNGSQTAFLAKTELGHTADATNTSRASYSVDKDLREHFAAAVRKSLGTEFKP